MILVVDNYDSFVYNLVHYLEIQGKETLVLSNDDPLLINAHALKPEAIIISPGPCTPSEAGFCVPMIRQVAPFVPVLGVCLGHQCIGAAFGAAVSRAPSPVHGQATEIYHADHPLFLGMSNPFPAARYHSLVLPEIGSVIDPLRIIAWTASGMNMGVAHQIHPSYGVQFHPESILTTQGMELIANFLVLANSFNSRKGSAHA